MNNDNKGTALKASFWYLVCSFLLKGIGFLTTPIFTRIMPIADYGVVSTYVSYSSVLTVLASLDIYTCIQISKQDFEDENDSVVSSVLFLSSVSIAIFYLIVKCIVLNHDIFGLPNYLLEIMFIEMLFSNAFLILQTQSRAFLRYKEVVFLTIFSTIMSVLLGLIIVSKMKTNTYYGRIIGSAIPTIGVGTYAFVRIFNRGKCYINNRFWKYALAISLPLIPHTMSGSILTYFDRIMINKYVGNEKVAMYSVAYSIASIVDLIYVSLNNAWKPWFFDEMKIDGIGIIRKATIPYTILFSMFVLGAITVAPEIIRIMSPKEYWGSIWVIPPVALGLFFQFVYGLYCNIEFYYKKTSKIAFATVISAVINILLNYLLIPRYGYISAAYTTLVGYLVMLILHVYMAKKIEKRDIYGDKFLVIISLCMIIFSSMAILLYRANLLFRYSALAIILGVFVLSNKKYITICIEYFKTKHKGEKNG